MTIWCPYVRQPTQFFFFFAMAYYKYPARKYNITFNNSYIYLHITILYNLPQKQGININISLQIINKRLCH